jgi:hypothetical protein
MPVWLGGPNAARDRAGRMWFVSANGLSIADPNKLRLTVPPAPVHVESVFVEGHRVEVPGRLNLAPHSSPIQIEYTSPTPTSAHKLRFRYRLSGFDREWTDAGTRREAIYTNLPPGDYRFEVMAVATDGATTTTPTGLDLTVQPAFAQTVPFFMAVMAACGIALWQLWRLRMRYEKRQFAMVINLGAAQILEGELAQLFNRRVHRNTPTFDSVQQFLVDKNVAQQGYITSEPYEIEKQGGYVRKYYQENVALAPPPLNGEGEKVQSQWFFNFLKAPVTLRPWLEIRMPTFGLSDSHATQLVNYFNGLSKVEQPYHYVDDRKIMPENIEAAKTLTSADYFNCFSCHVQGGKNPEGPKEGWAPDLAMARQRLNPNWIIKWLKDPQKVQPGTKMPSFYPGGPDNILGGKEDLQIEALRDYLMTLGRGAAPAAPVATPQVVKVKPVK